MTTRLLRYATLVPVLFALPCAAESDYVYRGDSGNAFTSLTTLGEWLPVPDSIAALEGANIETNDTMRNVRNGQIWVEQDFVFGGYIHSTTAATDQNGNPLSFIAFMFRKGVSDPPASLVFESIETVAGALPLGFWNLDADRTGSATINDSLTLNSELILGRSSSSQTSLQSSIDAFTVSGTTVVNSSGIISVSRVNTAAAESGIHLGQLVMDGGILNLTTGSGSNGSNSAQLNTVRVGTLSGSGTVRAGKNNTQGQLVVDGSGSSVFSGTITNHATNAVVSLGREGTGVLELTGTHTYTGATTVDGGVLRLSGSGSINSSSGVSVAEGGTFATDSSVAVTVDVTLDGGQFQYSSAAAYAGNLTFNTGVLGGTNWTGGLDGLSIGVGQYVSPGNSPGVAVGDSQSWLGGGGYIWQVFDASGVAGVGYDLIDLSGDLDLTGLSAEDTFSINVWSLSALNPDVSGDAQGFDPLASFSWLLVSADSILLNIGADINDLLEIELGAVPGFTDGFSNAYNGIWSVSLDGGDLFLDYAAIPEPAMTLLPACALAMAWMLRRRRQVRSE